MKLKQFAVYFPGPGRKVKRDESTRHSRHGHAHFHKREEELRTELQKREAAAEAGAALGDMVTAMINGKLESFPCTWAGCGGAPSAPPAEHKPAAAKAAAYELPSPSADAAPSKPTAPSEPPPSSHKSSGSGSAWSRAAYYSAEKQTSSGLVFLADNQW